MPDELLKIRPPMTISLFHLPLCRHAALGIDAAFRLQIRPDLRQRHFAVALPLTAFRHDAQSAQIRHIELIGKQIKQGCRIIHAAQQQRVEHIETDHIKAGQPPCQLTRGRQCVAR